MKKVLSSKTIWVNLIALIVSILSALGFNVVVTPETIMFILPVLNFILRFLTKDPLFEVK